jgi:hypothetical protein
MTPSSSEISFDTQTKQTLSSKYNYDKAVIGIGLGFGAGFGTLIILTTFAHGLPNSGSLLFGEDSSTASLEDGKVNLVITNQPGTSLKIIHFEALEEVNGFEISSLGLFDVEAGAKIGSEQILFNGSNPFSSKKIEPNSVATINFNASNENPGLYRGNFIVIMNGNSTLVPTTYEVKFNHWLIYVWVFNGIVVSVAALNLIGYYFLVKEQDAVRLAAASKINELIEYIQDPVTQEILPSATNYLRRTISKLQQSKPKSAKGDLMKINTLVKGTEAEVVKHVYSGGGNYI